MNFPYSQVITTTADIEIEDIGNCAVRAYTFVGSEYVLVIETRQGWSRIFVCGPMSPDLDILPIKTGMSYEKIAFNERKIKTKISSFVNMQDIVQAEVCTKETALNDCKNIIDAMRQPNF